MLRFLYNVFLPLGFVFFVPGLYLKYRNRPGWKDSFGERFGRFAAAREAELVAYHGAIWVHAVSVGETVLALSMIKKYSELHPGRKFVLSTTTTTGQELARKSANDRTAVIFCPIDFLWMVRKTLQVIRPSMLVIFETEIWPNMVGECRKRRIPVALVNGRMSDKSVRGYSKAKLFFGPLLKSFNLIMVQSDDDAKRFLRVSPQAKVQVSGNLKFDQPIPEILGDHEFAQYFHRDDALVLLAASTHSGEEELIAQTYLELRQTIANLKLVLVPRHAERGNEIAEMLAKYQLPFARRSRKEIPAQAVDVILADTTGEMLKLINGADVVIMGKSLAGHDEGHNLIEPALLDKPIVTGHVLRNFRFILNVLQQKNAVATVSSDPELAGVLAKLLTDEPMRRQLGERAGEAIRRHAGATVKTIEALEAIAGDK